MKSWRSAPRLPTRPRRRAAGQRGAVLVTTAMMLIAFLGVGALGIDLGSFYHAQRQTQSAADAAVLAASQDIPANSSNVDSDVKTYVADNDPAVPQTLLTYPGCMTASTPGICINYPYNSNSDEIQVKLIASTPAFLGNFFGLSSTTVSAQAAGGPGASTTYDAIFAKSSSCSSGITISGSSNVINGATVSNGSLTITGGSNTLGTTTYGGTNKCGYSNTGTGNKINGTTGATQTTTSSSWPEDFSSANPSACTLTSTSYSWTNSNQVIPSGVYCATSSITISGSNLSGNVTFIAPTISITGSNLNFTPDYEGLTYYQTGSGTLQLAGSSLSSGAVFAPNATVKITGGNITATGFIEANAVQISSSSFTFNGNGPTTAGSSFSLIQ